MKKTFWTIVYAQPYSTGDSLGSAMLDGPLDVDEAEVQRAYWDLGPEVRAISQVVPVLIDLDSPVVSREVAAEYLSPK